MSLFQFLVQLLNDVFGVLLDSIVLTRWLDPLILFGTNIENIVDRVNNLPDFFRRLVLFVDLELKILLKDRISC